MSIRPLFRALAAASVAGVSLRLAAAFAQDAATLKARHASLQDKFATTSSVAAVLESTQSSGDLKGDVYAVVEHPFSTVQQALVSPEHWCDILILHLNVKRCKASAGDAEDAQPQRRPQVRPADRGCVRAQLQVSRRCDERRLPAGAPERRRRPAQHEELPIQVEAVPIEAKRTVIHMSYAYGYGFAAKMAMQTYLATARQRQGRLHDRRQEADGKPVYQAGCSASRAQHDALLPRDRRLPVGVRLPPPSSPKSASASGTRAPSATPQQLHEMDEAEYLDMKRKEMRRQQES
jgi:hypothetical protein